MIKKFLIVAPPYTEKSAGVVCLHELCDGLIQNEYESHILIMAGDQFQYTNNNEFFSDKLSNTNRVHLLKKLELQSIIDDGIVVYPEIVVGNPLGAKNVVRYFLNEDGMVTGKKSNYSDKEFRLAYFEKFVTNPHALLFKPIINPSFHDNGTLPHETRPLNTTYIGKGSKYGKCFRLPHTIEITREYPKAKEELSILLRNTNFFFSWDSVSSTNFDAILCGAKLVLMQDLPQSRDSMRNWKTEFGFIPFLVGRVQDGKVYVEDNKDYDSIRNLLLKNIVTLRGEWVDNVRKTAELFFRYFSG